MNEELAIGGDSCASLLDSSMMDYDKWKFNPPTRVDEDEQSWEADMYVKQQKEKEDERSERTQTQDH